MTTQSEVIGNPKYTPILDHGFVGLVDIMGDDDCIADAARTSYGKGTKSVSQNEGLIRYLMKNMHTSPIEMVELKFHLKIPIFVMRQHVRHRTACLSGDTVLDFVLGGNSGKNPENGGRHKVTVKEAYERWTFGGFGNRREDYDLSFIDPDKYYSASKIGYWFLNRQEKANELGLNVKMEAGNRKIIDYYLGKDILEFYANEKKQGKNNHREMLQGMLLRSLNEDTGEVYFTNISDIWETGEKPVFELTVGNGDKYNKSIKASEDHLFFTENGWKQLKEIQIGDKVWTASSHFTVEVNSKELVGIEKTYDIEVTGPFHNFSANSFIVHNSLNEYSGRYSEMTDEMYMPSASRLQEQSANNKQGSGDELEPQKQAFCQQLLKRSYEESFKNYEATLKYNLSKELSRIQLPVANYTELYWKIDLKNFFHYIKLRTDSHAQYEIQVLANAMYDLVKPLLPIACQAFEDYWLNSVTFSHMELDIIRDFLHDISEELGTDFVYEELYHKCLNKKRMGKRETEEFLMRLLGPRVK